MYIVENYLKKNNISYAEFGRKIGHSRDVIRKWAAGINIPKKESMTLIIQATNNEVKIEDFYRPQQPQEKK